MKIVIENHRFDYDMGCRMLKLKYQDKCPFPELEDIWNDIKPLTFAEIAQLKNLEERRVGISCLGIERLIAEVKPTLVDKKTIKKITTWVDDEGKLVKHKFSDTYELFEVSGESLSKGLEGWQRLDNQHFIRCKDTSTDREYLIWVDIRSVYQTNNPDDRRWNIQAKDVNAIECISWTIQTDVPEGKIEKILRQGDCILIKPTGKYTPLVTPRHLTEKEYRELLVAES